MLSSVAWNALLEGLLVWDIVRFAPDVDVGKPRSSPFLLFLDPFVEANLLHALAVGKHRNVALGKTQYPFAWVFVAERANIYALRRGALPDGTERGPAGSFATAAVRLGFCQSIKETPEFLEIGHRWPPVLDRLFSQCVAQFTRLLGRAVAGRAQTAVQPAVRYLFQISHVLLLPITEIRGAGYRIPWIFLPELFHKTDILNGLISRLMNTLITY